MTDTKPAKPHRLKFKAIAEAALSGIDRVLTHWLPNGKRQGSEYVALNPTRADKSAHSFSVNLNSGVWSDFATGDKGGDLVDLVAYLGRTGKRDAGLTLAAFLGMTERQYLETPPDAPQATREAQRAPPQGQHQDAHEKASTAPEWAPVFPVPDSALPSRPATFPRLGKPSQTWQYNDPAGRPLFWVYRFDVAGPDNTRAKDYRPLCFAREANGATGWAWKQPPDRRPLYGLDLLGNDTAAPVLLTEGEKDADAARHLITDAVAMAWPGGSKAIGKADFSPLAGREVWYWPDNDKPGRDSVPVLAAALAAAEVDRFALVNVALFNRYTPGRDDQGAPLLVDASAEGAHWPEKAGAADALALGWTFDHLALLRAAGLVTPYAAKGSRTTRGANASTDTAEGAPAGPDQREGRFKSTADGLYHFDMKAECYRRIGGRLDVLARSRNQDGSRWGLLVSFDDFDGHRKEWNIPAALFATEGGADIVRGLLDRGYSIAANREARKRLLEYLGDFPTADRVRLVERMGWHGEAAFLLPSGVIGTPPEPLHYYSDAPPLCKMAQAGTVDQWRENVAAYCLGNPLLSFAVSAAFAPPLLDVLGSETCGFHFVGDSSLGKSTLLKVAASVYGHPGHYPRTWRATDNALEATASAHSDCLLILDEIGQIEPRIVGETVYMLGNGEGKTRATETGAARGAAHRWRLVFLSSGEKTLIDHMAEAHKKPQAGMEMRLLTLPASPHSNTADRKRLGIYHQDQGFPGGAELSAHLTEQAGKYHGAALVEFLTLVTRYDREKLVKTVCHLRDLAKSGMVMEGASGQVHRAADKFALVAAAGELATMLGITGWPMGEAIRAAEYCFNAWLTFRGGAGNLEDKQALDHVRLMLTKYGESKFTRWESDSARIDEHAPRTMERWGFRKTEEDNQMGTTDSLFYMPADGFKEFCHGQDANRVARLLKERGALITDNEPGRMTKKARLPGSGKNAVNCYVIRLSALLADADNDSGEPETPPPEYGAVSGF